MKTYGGYSGQLGKLLSRQTLSVQLVQTGAYMPSGFSYRSVQFLVLFMTLGTSTTGSSIIGSSIIGSSIIGSSTTGSSTTGSSTSSSGFSWVLLLFWLF